jgi:hypothetical protein
VFCAGIKMANVSVLALVCFATLGLFNAVLEPLPLNKKNSVGSTAGMTSLKWYLIPIFFHFDTLATVQVYFWNCSALLGALFQY